MKNLSILFFVLFSILAFSCNSKKEEKITGISEAAMNYVIKRHQKNGFDVEHIKENDALVLTDSSGQISIVTVNEYFILKEKSIGVIGGYTYNKLKSGAKISFPDPEARLKMILFEDDFFDEDKDLVTPVFVEWH